MSLECLGYLANGPQNDLGLLFRDAKLQPRRSLPRDSPQLVIRSCFRNVANMP